MSGLSRMGMRADAGATQVGNPKRSTIRFMTPIVQFERIAAAETLHTRVTRSLARSVIRADRDANPFEFPAEGELCERLGVSRTIVREALKVLADKGMVEIRPRSGVRSAPRKNWNLLDPDILTWQAAENPDLRFLYDLCEVRLALEPTAAGFAAIRATDEDRAAIDSALARRVDVKGLDLDKIVDLDLLLHVSIVNASHNPFFQHLSATIESPFRLVLARTLHIPTVRELDLNAHRQVVKAIRRRDPAAARAAADKLVGYAMLAVERAVQQTQAQPRRGKKERARANIGDKS